MFFAIAIALRSSKIQYLWIRLHTLVNPIIEGFITQARESTHISQLNLQAMLHYARELHDGKSVDVVKRKFYFTEDVIEFLPESWTSSANCWTVKATETNLVSF